MPHMATLDIRYCCQPIPANALRLRCRHSTWQNGYKHRCLCCRIPSSCLRGSGHNQYGGYTEDATEYQQVVDRLRDKWHTACKLVPQAITHNTGSPNSIGVIAFGSSHGATTEAMERLSAEGCEVDYLRLRAFPFGAEVQDFLDQHQSVFVVEQNRDAQMRSLLLLELHVEQDKLIPILHYNGLPIPSDLISDRIKTHLQSEAVA
jgi:2-oxoglutarate ferredoxin oxidoreductase subunit alpha